jgi:DNA-binding transcriptional LysR family regulator
LDQLLALRVFVRIAEAGTFARAADSLHIPKPTVTKLVQNLESHLGVKLLQRTTRRVTVTPEGAAYYERAVDLITELQDMDALVGKSRVQHKGRLRVDIGSSLANMILIPALPEFGAMYPEIQLELGVSDRAVDLIGDGVDCVIRGGVLADTSLVGRRIAELEYMTCASSKYVEKYGAPRHPADLEREHRIVSYFSSLTGRRFPLYFEHGTEQLEIQARGATAVNESTAHLTALLNGLGIGQTFTFMAAPHVASGALTVLLDEWTRPKHPLHVLYPPTRHLNAKVRVFVDWVAEVFSSKN